MSSAATITAGEFKDALSRYPALIKSMNKASKPGVLTLEELDTFRYVDAPARFSKSAGGKAIELEDLQKLVDWKLRHGIFRPTLPKLVASNSNDLVKESTSDAFAHYKKSPAEIATVIKKLSDPLKGVGPATASLLLAVHDPDNIIFFSDEAYRWLCANGGAASPKYSVKEFDDLFEKSKALMSRLGVKATEIEKVSYVLIKEAKPTPAAKPGKEPTGRPRGRPSLPESEKKAKKVTVPGRGRGRPPKAKGPEDVTTAKAGGEPKKRGRPPKAKTEEGDEAPAKVGKRKGDGDDGETEEHTPRSKRPKAD